MTRFTLAAAALLLASPAHAADDTPKVLKDKVAYCLFRVDAMEKAFAQREAKVGKDEALKRLTTIIDNDKMNEQIKTSVLSVYEHPEVQFKDAAYPFLRECLLETVKPFGDNPGPAAGKAPSPQSTPGSQPQAAPNPEME